MTDTVAPSRTAAAPIDPQHLRHVLGSYPTGVAVITGRGADGRPVGMVVGTFSSVSMDPPLVSFMPMRSSRTFTELRGSDTFCVNIMAADQERLCGAFMRPPDEKFTGVDWREAPGGAPIIEGATAWIECGWADVLDVGDHHFVLGSVRALATERSGLPLLFFQRGYGRFTPGSLMAADHRTLAAAIRLAEAGRREMEFVAAELDAEAGLLAPLGEEFAFVATAGTRGASHATLPGTRLPFVPPLGTLMVGHPGAPTVTEWLDRVPGSAPELREAAARRLERVQERGWSLTLAGEVDGRTLDELVDAFSAPSRAPENEKRLLDAVRRMADCHEPDRIDPDASYAPLQLSVPVRDGDGHVVLVLRLSGLPERCTGAELTGWIQRLGDSATAIESRLAEGDSCSESADSM